MTCSLQKTQLLLGSVHHNQTSVRIEKRATLLSDFTLFSEHSVGYLREVELSEIKESSLLTAMLGGQGTVAGFNAGLAQSSNVRNGILKAMLS